MAYDPRLDPAYQSGGGFDYGIWSGMHQEEEPLKKDKFGRDPNDPLYGAPMDLTYQELSGNLLPENYQLSGNLDTQALDYLQNQALTEGPSAWRNLMQEQLDTQKGLRRDQLAQQSATQAAQAQNQLAMTGGLRGGQAERIAQNAARERLLGGQRLGAEFQQLGQQYNIQDEANRQNILSALPGMQMQKSQYETGIEQYNIDKALQEEAAKRDFEMQKYKEQMAAWGADKTADATESQGGCWICTVVNNIKPIGTDERATLFEFKKYVLKNHRDAARFYLKDCKPLIEKMSDKGYDWSDMVGFDKAIVTLVNAGEMEAAYVLYRNTTLRLIGEYWPECDDPRYLGLRQASGAIKNKEEILDGEIEDTELLVPILQDLSPN